MANVAVDAAIKSLQAIGIPIPSYMDGFIELLVDAGEDVLTTVPHIISVTEQLGAETWSTLEEVVSGMQLYGPQGYIRRKIDAAFDPHIETIRTIHRNKQALYTYHQSTLATLQKHVDTLYTGPQSFTGPAATQAQTSFTTLKSQVSNHLDLLNQSMAIDQKFFTDVQNSKDAAVDAAIISLIIMGIVLVVALATAAFSGGLSLAIVGVGTVGVSAEEAGALAIVAGCFVAWGIAHELLAHPISINWQPSITLPASHPLISADPTFPDPELGTAGKALVNELSNEFGGAVSEATLEYLIKVLGTGPAAAAMIRCLFHNGYLNVSTLDPKNTSLIADYNTAWSAINDHLKPNDLGGAWKENNPDQVDPTTIKDPNNISGGAHDDEVENALKSLDNAIKRLNNAIQSCDKQLMYASRKRLTDTEIADLVSKKDHLQKLKDAFEKVRDFVQNIIQKDSPSPDTWSDQGKLPLVDDLLQASTCNVTYTKYTK